MERHLAAILAADVVGYSRLMEVDEAGTLTALKAHRKEVIDPKIAAHRGRIVKLMGDGALVEFASVVDALTCAIDIQQRMQERNQDIPAERRILFRMGINLGDVIAEGDDIYGEGVNVAARLEELAEPGGVCISEAVQTAIGNKIPLDYEDLGTQNVKNISQPIHVYQVQLRPGAVLPQPAAEPTQIIPGAATNRRRLPVAVGALISIVAVVVLLVMIKPWQAREEPASIARMAFTLPDKPSVAVLPFTNMSGDPNQEYFGDGLTENIITSLSQLPTIFVIARNSVFTYKNKPVRVQQVAEELGIQYVLEGSFQRSGNHIRIHAQFIDALSGHHLWAERFDTILTDIFKMQDQVTRKIVSALQVQFTEEDQKRLASQYTDNYEAYDYFLHGQLLYNRFSRQDNEQARRLFETAIDLDEKFARAYALVALTYEEEYRQGWSEKPAKSVARAIEYADRALTVNNQLPQAHWVRGHIYLYAQRRFEEAREHATKAISLDVNSADNHVLLAIIKMYLGSPADAVPLIQKAIRLNPHASSRYYGALGRAFYFQRHYKEAIAALLTAISKNPAFPMHHVYLAAAYKEAGRTEDAEWEALELLALAPNFSVDEWLTKQPFKNVSQAHQLADTLRAAGLP